MTTRSNCHMWWDNLGVPVFLRGVTTFYCCPMTVKQKCDNCADMDGAISGIESKWRMIFRLFNANWYGATREFGLQLESCTVIACTVQLSLWLDPSWQMPRLLRLKAVCWTQNLELYEVLRGRLCRSGHVWSLVRINVAWNYLIMKSELIQTWSHQASLKTTSPTEALLT